MKYFVVYNIICQHISAFISSYNPSNFSKIFDIMKAGLKNGDVILEIEDECNGEVAGYKNIIKCQQILQNLANGESLTHTES